MVIETTRLIIEPMRDSDLDAFFELTSDPEVMRYIRTPEPWEAFLERVMRVRAYAKDKPGFGSYRLGDRSTGAFLGNAIVRHVNFEVGNDIEIGYLLAKTRWGQGYGTEVAAALSDFVLTQLQAPKVVAYVETSNKASERVLLKCGFVVVAEEQIYDGLCLRLEKSAG
jgi:RimJ/RimL family protein N-acetyltransferase